jgi:hypothetical protein
MDRRRNKILYWKIIFTLPAEINTPEKIKAAFLPELFLYALSPQTCCWFYLYHAFD